MFSVNQKAEAWRVFFHALGMEAVLARYDTISYFSFPDRPYLFAVVPDWRFSDEETAPILLHKHTQQDVFYTTQAPLYLQQPSIPQVPWFGILSIKEGCEVADYAWCECPFCRRIDPVAWGRMNNSFCGCAERLGLTYGLQKHITSHELDRSVTPYVSNHRRYLIDKLEYFLIAFDSPRLVRAYMSSEGAFA